MIKQFISRVFVVAWVCLVFALLFEFDAGRIDQWAKNSLFACSILIAVQWIVLSVVNPFKLLDK